jgi:hypothetical protein
MYVSKRGVHLPMLKPMAVPLPLVLTKNVSGAITPKRTSNCGAVIFHNRKRFEYYKILDKVNKPHSGICHSVYYNKQIIYF